MALFYNYSTERFTHTWGGIPYSFKPGEVYTGILHSVDGEHAITLNDVLANFFAKHLAVDVLNSNREVGKDALKYNMSSIDMLIERGITAPEIDKPMPAFSEELPIIQKEPEEPKAEEEVEPEEPKKKPGRPAKVKEEASPSANAEFDV
jgi:hypothetical protein